VADGTARRAQYGLAKTTARAVHSG
jgi:hypothetical protein